MSSLFWYGLGLVVLLAYFTGAGQIARRFSWGYVGGAYVGIIGQAFALIILHVINQYT